MIYKTLGQLINTFDNAPESTVRQFNELFVNCPLTQNSDATVEILEPIRCSSDYQLRELLVDGQLIEHEMHVHRKLKEREDDKKIFIDELYGINTDFNIFEDKLAVSEEEDDTEL